MIKTELQHYFSMHLHMVVGTGEACRLTVSIYNRPLEGKLKNREEICLRDQVRIGKSSPLKPGVQEGKKLLIKKRLTI